MDAPLGDFFAVGHGMERPVTSEVVRNGSSGRSRNCYWPMPFRKSCRITVANEGRALYHQELPAEMGNPIRSWTSAGAAHLDPCAAA